MTRTDRHNNPTAFTVRLAEEAGLVLNTDYTVGDPFNTPNGIEHTAKLLGDPLKLTVTLIDKVSFYTKLGSPRWIHTAMRPWIWNTFDVNGKIKIIHDMYRQEGGTVLEHLFN